MNGRLELEHADILDAARALTLEHGPQRMIPAQVRELAANK
jgi:hypothetical protein